MLDQQRSPPPLWPEEGLAEVDFPSIADLDHVPEWGDDGWLGHEGPEFTLDEIDLTSLSPGVIPDDTTISPFGSNKLKGATLFGESPTPSESTATSAETAAAPKFAPKVGP
jgi:hypothetical protein